MNECRFASPRQAARIVPLTEHFIRQLIATGKCPGFYVGSHFKVDVVRLLAQIDAMAEAGGKL